MLETRVLLLLLALLFAPEPSLARAPYALRISCGARDDIHTSPTNTLWYKDFAYTGGIPANATLPSFISPPLKMLRFFPLSEGPENCYNIKNVPRGHYLVRIFFGLVKEPSFDNEPLFDVSIEGTLIYSLPSGWSNHDDEHAFVEGLIFLKDGTASLCFHSTGHGDPAILAVEILQIDNRAYFFGNGYGQGTILRTDRRLNCGAEKPKFGADYSADKWGGDRFWNFLPTFGEDSDKVISTENSIKQTSESPNFYPEAIYQNALTSTDTQPDLSYNMEVEPTRNYSLWLHFAEIDPSVTKAGQRVFDVLINGDIVFRDVDIFSMSGGANSALVLNTTYAVSGRSLTITFHPTKGDHALISAIELLELVLAESKTLPAEIKALQKLKDALGLPLRLGWNGDPCVPEQHPWSGVDCQYNKSISKHVIDGLGLDNQGLRGFLPNDISQLRHLQSINLSGNSISGVIPSSLGSIPTLEILDLSYNSLNGSIPESLGQLISLRILDLNGNSLSGKVPSALGGRLLHGASFKRQNILRAQRIAARDAPYAKARTHFNRDVQMGRHQGQENAKTAAENGPSLLA